MLESCYDRKSGEPLAEARFQKLLHYVEMRAQPSFNINCNRLGCVTNMCCDVTVAGEQSDRPREREREGEREEREKVGRREKGTKAQKDDKREMVNGNKKQREREREREERAALVGSQNTNFPQHSLFAFFNQMKSTAVYILFR